jgi:hypothetical protein
MLNSRFIPTILLHTALLSAAIFTGCAAHVSAVYRVYDPYYSDYHVWGPGEDGYYRQWIGERHYQYQDFRRLPADRQKDYWTWRHSQPAAPPHP